ncbi:hypothetical protein AMJ39_00480 [candidate division TA06 bacterium DG_24]|uniref:Biopolymer transporter ExbD n=3 Tax=Bacteria division TA06 TaxID=1156500 RepID=A0A0S8JHL6_UNCT6|nr:MAG: hypothetical protein AMJ39_00480 [candidate division TA06 bacterium DG_24]KPK67373.1 MAG: hypothetical protein AMJ82_10755 [candidate division TA06 bacterium SM23_40]KPL09185.1 MAG: hypothetical protein AMJ71_07075 [candidate division TA06 bacterium SM1_40]
MRLPPRRGVRATIPTASMADIAFLLIIFFMVSTVFRTEQGLKVFLPVAEATERLPRRNIVHLWIAADGQISVDDYTVNPSQVRGIVALKLTENPNLIVSLVADRRTRYRVVSEVMDQLREALALRVSFTTKFER